MILTTIAPSASVFGDLTEDVGHKPERSLRLGNRVWILGEHGNLDQPPSESVYDEGHRNEPVNPTDDPVGDPDFGQELWAQTLAVQFGVRLREFSDLSFDGTRDVEFDEYVRWSIEQYGTVAIAAWHHAARQLRLTEHQSTPTTHEVDAWFDSLEQDARDAGNLTPTAALVEETKRIVSGLDRDLLEGCDVYTLEQGEIAVEIFGERGHAFLLTCEPGGGALCVIAQPGYSRRARYESSKSLPDNFLRDGLIAVRRAHGQPQSG